MAVEPTSEDRGATAWFDIERYNFTCHNIACNMSAMDKLSAVDALGALAHPIRLDAFRTLVVAGHTGLTPGVLVEMLGITYAKLGFHLKDLLKAGLVTQEQAGRHMIYRAAFARMDELLAFLTDNCCKGLPVASTAIAADAPSCC
jgi:ArsR family transcriptional regulator